MSNAKYLRYDSREKQNVLISFGQLGLTIILIGILTHFISCKKFLDKPPSKTAVIPKTLEDLQAVLDYQVSVNEEGMDLLEHISDNYYVTSSTWQNAFSNLNSIDFATNYIWDKEATYKYGWVPYQKPIYTSNFVLDILPGIEKKQSNAEKWNNIKGAALFYRSFAFRELAQLYCKPFTSSDSTDLGLPLRITSDINVESIRSSVKETYAQIINDLLEAASLLPEATLFPTRPTKAAAYGLLARTYLCMRDYSNAYRFSDSVLKRSYTLLDYNTLNLSAISAIPQPQSNPEVIYYNIAIERSNFANSLRGIIDTILYRSYDTNDLRKQVFFFAKPEGYAWRGSYASNRNSKYTVFDGITVDEAYLIRAECFARQGNLSAALNDLNALLVKRWKNNGSFVPVTAANQSDALNKILMERRKELVYRGLRWEDLRRFNLEGSNIELKRIIGIATYTLPANDLRWVLLIPWDVINKSGMQQNPR